MKNTMWLHFLLVVGIAAHVDVHAGQTQMVPAQDQQKSQFNEVDAYFAQQKFKENVLQKARRIWNSDPVLRSCVYGALIFCVTTAFTHRLQEELRNAAISSDEKNAFEVIYPENLKKGFSDIIVNEETKSKFLQLSKYNKNKEAYIKNGIPCHAGIVAYGPPGVGKTEMLMATAKESDVPVLKLNASGVNGRYVASGDRAIQSVLARCEEIFKETGKTPMIIIDEAETLFHMSSSDDSASTDHNGTLSRIKSAMTDPNTHAFWALTTNYPEKISKEIIRPGRCELVPISAPDQKTFGEITKHKFYTGTLQAEPGLEKYIVDLSTGLFEKHKELTGATATVLANNARIQATDKGLPIITRDIINDTFSNFKSDNSCITKPVCL